jgi:ArsR family transcriptional regulator, arsenate/arsenite/antimonite-responsive transcriptional repressor / arsenate reductase (thioredoxin)
MDVSDRARVHAALGDPGRLAIVDTLTVGDAAPSELGTALGLPTNLIAHHLNVLQQAGLVTRTRSEGDRRRTYIQLVPQALPAIARPVLAPAPRIVFVCTHNSARSQLAAAIWPQHSPIPAASAGTNPADQVHLRAIRVGRRHGLDLDRATTAHIRDVIHRGDMIVAVCDAAHEHLTAHLPRARSKARRRLHWSVPDPARVNTNRAFETAFTDLLGRITRLAPTLNPLTP